MKFSNLIHGAGGAGVAAGENECDRNLVVSAPVHNKVLALNDDLRCDAVDSTCFFVDIHSGVVDDKVESVGVANFAQLSCQFIDVFGPIGHNEVGIVGAVVMIETDDGQIELFDAREPVDDLSGATAAVRVKVKN